MPPRADEAVLDALRRAGEPVREAVLYHRIHPGHPEVTEEAFIALLERLVTQGRVRVAFDHEMPGRDPAPFAPRYYHHAV